MIEEKAHLHKATLVGRNATFLMSARIFSTFLTLVLFAWIGRRLGPSLFGEYTLALVTIAHVYSYLTDFGARHYTTRAVALDKSKMGVLIVNGSIAKGLVTIVTLVPMLLFVRLMYGGTYGMRIVALVAVASLTVILRQCVAFLMAFYDGCERMHVTALVNAGMTVFVVVCVGTVLWAGADTAMPLLLAEALGLGIITLVSLCLAVRLTRSTPMSLDMGMVRDFCKKMMPFGLYFLFGILYFRADGFMLSKMAGWTETGMYLAVIKPLATLEMMPNMVAAALYPTLSKEMAVSIERGRRMFGEALRVLFAMALPIVLGCSIFSDKIAVAIFEEEFAGSGPLLMVLAWVLLLRFPAYASNTVLFATNRQALGAVVAAVFAVINVAMNLVLIPRYGAKGAAVASVITCWAVEIVRYLIVRRVVGGPGLPRLWGPILCAGAIMAAVGLLLRAHNIPLAMAVAIEAVVYCAALLTVGGVKQQDLTLIKRILSPSKR